MRGARLLLSLAVLVLLWPATAVWADGPIVTFDGGQIFVDEDVSLVAGQTFDGDLGILRGNLTMPEGSVVNGDLFVTSGNAFIAGRVKGNLAILNGELTLTPTGQVAGDIFGLRANQDVAGQVEGDLTALFGNMALRHTALVRGDLLVAPGHLQREAGARVLGNQVYDLEKGLEQVPGQIPTPPAMPILPRPSHRATWRCEVGRFLGRVLAAAFLSLLSIGLGVLVAAIWPRPTRRVSDCIATWPGQSFGLGLLTFLIAAGLEALAAILIMLIWLVAAVLLGTVILIPLGLLLILLSPLLLLPVPVVLAGAVILGWVGLSDLIGQKALRLLKATGARPVGTVLVGLLLTVAIAALLWIVKPVCCAGPFVILVSSVGLGAVIHTRLGRQSGHAAAPPPQPEVLPAEAMEREAGQPDGPAP